MCLDTFLVLEILTILVNLTAKNAFIEAIPYSASSSGIMISKERPEVIQFTVDSPCPELPPDEKIQKWNTGLITVNTCTKYLPCQECEEDIDEEDHYP